MSMPTQQLIKFSLFLLFLGGFASVAYAYVDPGIAGVLYQILYMAIAVVIAYFAGLKRLLKKFFSRRKVKAKEQKDVEKV